MIRIPICLCNGLLSKVIYESKLKYDVYDFYVDELTRIFKRTLIYRIPPVLFDTWEEGQVLKERLNRAIERVSKEQDGCNSTLSKTYCISTINDSYYLQYNELHMTNEKMIRCGYYGIIYELNNKILTPVLFS